MTCGKCWINEDSLMTYCVSTAIGSSKAWDDNLLQDLTVYSSTSIEIGVDMQTLGENGLISLDMNNGHEQCFSLLIKKTCSLDNSSVMLLGHEQCFLFSSSSTQELFHLKCQHKDNISHMYMVMMNFLFFTLNSLKTKCRVITLDLNTFTWIPDLLPPATGYQWWARWISFNNKCSWSIVSLSATPHSMHTHAKVHKFKFVPSNSSSSSSSSSWKQPFVSDSFHLPGSVDREATCSFCL